MGKYRKYLEPEYGEAGPEVEIAPPQILDLDRPKEWRIKSNYESIMAMTSAYQKCRCYPDVMEVKTEDVRRDFGNGEITIRVYYRSSAILENKPGPVLLFFHGGAFSMNSIDVYEYVCRYLACFGKMTVISPDYHLAPEYKFPKGLEEAYQTLVWAEENVKNYGGDKENIHVCGDSSGGNFAAAVAAMSADRNGPGIQSQNLVYPLVTNWEEGITESEKRYGKGYFLEYCCMDDPMKLYFNSEEEKKDPLASPLLKEDIGRMPRTCIIAAECDPLVDQGLMYAAKLQDAGVEVEYHMMKGMIHGFLNWTYRSSFEAMDRIIENVNR